MSYEEQNWNRIDRMVHVLWNLTPEELHRLVIKKPLTETMRVAASIRVEEASRWSYDNFDVATFRGNIFYDFEKTHPVHGPMPFCTGCMSNPCVCDEELPF